MSDNVMPCPSCGKADVQPLACETCGHRWHPAPPSDPAAPLREALQEVADWFATMPLADVGIVGAGYLGRDVIERADVVADRVRAALSTPAAKETDHE